MQYIHRERSHVRSNGAGIQLRVLCGLESKWPLAFSLSKRECLPSGSAIVVLRSSYELRRMYAKHQSVKSVKSRRGVVAQ